MRRALIACVIPACLLLAGCGQESREPALDSAERIVSLAPHITELVYTAGGGDRLVGVVEYSDFPEAARELPRIGDAFRIDLERIAELDPDLILAWEDGNPPEMIESLTARGFRVVALKPSGLASVSTQLEQISALLGTGEQTRSVIDAFNARLAALKKPADSGKLSVFYQISAQPLYTVSGKHMISEIIDSCGGQNVFTDLPGLASVVDVESVLVRNPGVILIGHDAANARGFWDRRTEIKAVEMNTVYFLNADTLTRPTVRILDGMEEVCRSLDNARERLAVAAR